MFYDIINSKQNVYISSYDVSCLYITHMFINKYKYFFNAMCKSTFLLHCTAINVLFTCFFFLFHSRKERIAGKAMHENPPNSLNLHESQYTDLQVNSRASRDYTELQSRNEDYSSFESTDHSYVNTHLQT